MNVSGVRKEIKELKNSIIWKHDPVCKAFIMGAKDTPQKPRLKPAGKIIHKHGQLSFTAKIAVQMYRNKFYSKCNSDSKKKGLNVKTYKLFYYIFNV